MINLEKIEKKKKKRKMDVELRPFPNLVLKRGKEDLQAGGGCSSLCEIPLAKNGGKRGEAGGKSQEKVQVTLFFFLETNSG